MNLMFDSWRDALEILFFSTVFYHLTRWLKADTNRNLLPYFYGTLAIGLVSHLCTLSTVSHFLFLFAPSAVALFILMHQDTLERNIVAVKNITTDTALLTDWIETLVRACLTQMNDNRTVVCVIENHDSLTPFLECQLPLHASINDTLLNILYQSTLTTDKDMLWILYNGTLKGVNAAWKHTRQLSSDYVNNTNQVWKYDAQLYTSKTDCFLLCANPLNRSFTLIAEGIITENIPAHTVASHIKKHISHFSGTTKKKGVLHVVPQTYATRQRTP